jgi:hypothetical protein
MSTHEVPVFDPDTTGGDGSDSNSEALRVKISGIHYFVPGLFVIRFHLGDA